MPPSATWHPVPTHLGCDEAAAAYAQEIADVTLDIAVNGMGPDGHTASLFPGFPQVQAGGVCVAVHGSPKPPPDRVTLTLPKLNASHRIVLAVAGADKAPLLARVIAGPDPEGPPRSGPRAPGDRRRRRGPRCLRGLAAAPCRDRVVATGKHTGRTDIPLTDKGRDLARALRTRLEGRSFALVLCSPLSRARETAQLAGLEPRPRRRPPGVGLRRVRGPHHPGDPHEIPDWYLWRDGAPGGERPDDVAARCDRAIARLRSTEGEVAVVAHGHILRAIAARWVDAPVALGPPAPGHGRDLRARLRGEVRSSAAGTARPAPGAAASRRAGRGRSACDRAAARSG